MPVTNLAELDALVARVKAAQEDFKHSLKRKLTQSSVQHSAAKFMLVS